MRTWCGCLDVILSVRPCEGAAGALQRMNPSLRMTISSLFAGSQQLSLRRIRDSDTRNQMRILRSFLPPDDTQLLMRSI